MRYFMLLLSVLLSTVFTACRERSAAESPASRPGAPAASAMPVPGSPGPEAAGSPAGVPTSDVYEIDGTITEVAPDRRSVTLDHDQIPGLMPAMKMQYRVSQPELLKGLATGDRVHGRLQVKGTDYVLTSLARR